MNEREMFEKSFERPSNYFKLSYREQWEIDKRLGILDWKGEGLTLEDKKRFNWHYKGKYGSINGQLVSREFFDEYMNKLNLSGE